MKRYYDYIVRKNDEEVEIFLESRVLDSKERNYGGYREKFVDVKQTVFAFSYMSAAYVCPESRYYKSQDLVHAMDLALDYFHRELRPSNTFDFVMCNFSSGPDTAFCVEKLVPSYKLLKDEGLLGPLLNKLYDLIEKMTFGICQGGFHTPNHRWAISAALLLSGQINKDPDKVKAFKYQADLYLNEGIDCNPDGEYAERSSGNYNAVVNNALISLYELSGNKDYLDYIKRNLKMMLYYFDPDDTIFTDNSTRQDKGTKEYGLKYFFQYLYLAKDDPIFSSAARKLIEDGMKRQASPKCLPDLLLRRNLLELELSAPQYLLEYNKLFSESGVVRYRKNDLSYSLVKGAKNFLILKYKNMRLPIHIGVSLCHIRYFEIQDIQALKDGYEMTFKGQGWYYRPFEEKPETSDWWQMDHSQRKLVKNNAFKMTVTLKHLDHGIALKLDAKGYEHIPFRLEVAVPDRCMLENDHLTMQATAGNYMILKNDAIRIQGQSSACHIKKGFFSHNYLGHPTNDPRNTRDFSLIMTGQVPFMETIEFTFEDIKWFY